MNFTFLTLINTLRISHTSYNQSPEEIVDVPSQYGEVDYNGTGELHCNGRQLQKWTFRARVNCF